MAGIASPGVGSGLDVKTLVASLMKIAQQPVLRINQKEAQVQASISAYGSLKSSLSALQDTMTTLQTEGTFQTLSASATTAETSPVLTVSSDDTAIPASYSVTVDRLAQAHKVGSDEFSTSTSFGGGVGDTMTLTAGSTSFEVDLSTSMSLAQVQAAINVEANATGITAGVITGDSGKETLVLTSATTGYSDRVQLSYGGALNSSTFNFSMLNRDSSDVLLATEAELDASLTVDGVTVTRSSNSISDVVSGLTLNLETTGQSTVSIAYDSSGATNSVNAFVKAYNATKDQLAAAKDGGASDSLVRSVESQLRGILNGSGPSSSLYKYVSELGVTSNADTGKLEYDSSDLTAALTADLDGVIAFFTDTSNGFAVRMDAALEGFVEASGTIDSIVSGATDQASRLASSRDSLNRRLEGVERRYNQQFTSLDVLMASMTSTSNYLGRQLDILDNLVTRSK